MLTIRDGLATQHEVYLNKEGASPDRVPFGIRHFDISWPAGVKPASPQINLVQGQGGSRKTTTLLNIWLRMALSGMLPEGMKMVWDTLESGVTIERLIVILQCMLASGIMIYERHTGPQGPDTIFQLLQRDLPDLAPEKLLDIRSSSGRRELVLKPDYIEACYLEYGDATLSERQRDAWYRAEEILEYLPMVFYGASEHPLDEIREGRYDDTPDIDAASKRWANLSQQNGGCQIAVDYAQQYRIEGDGGYTHEHYQKQLTIAPYVDDWVKKFAGTFWLVTQEKDSDADKAWRGRVPSSSSGGNILKNSAQLNFRVDYFKEKNPFWVTFTAMKARRGDFPKFGQMIDPQSGMFFGHSVDYGRIKNQFGY